MPTKNISTYMNLKTFCIVPFLGGCVKSDGKMSACCQSKDKSSFSYEQIYEWFNSEKMIKFREEIYHGIPNSWCVKCYSSESNGQRSLRQIYNKELISDDVKDLITKIVTNNFYTTHDIKFVDLKLGNLCNLQCIMCNPKSSSKIKSEWIKNKHLFPQINDILDVDFSWPENENFKNKFLPLMQNVKYIKFTGGEPLLNPYIDEFLKKISDDCLVHLSTNLTTIDDNKINELKRFKNLWFTISIDAIGKLYEIIRYPASWKSVECNLQKIVKSLPLAKFSIAITLTPLSILRIDETINFLKKIIPTVNFIEVTDPQFMSINAIDEKYLEQINQKINNINDKKLKIELKNIFKNYNFDEKLYQKQIDFIKTIENIRNIKINHNEIIN